MIATRRRCGSDPATFRLSSLNVVGLCDVMIRFFVLGLCAALITLVPALRIAVGLLLVAWVAYANGSNDVSKAIATLVGSGTTSYRRAVVWGSAATVLGAGLSALTGTALVATFSSGLIAHQPTLAFSTAVMVGTAAWVLLSSRFGLPVSTTHALTGSIVFAGAFAFGAEHVRWATLIQRVALPLVLSPLIGAGLAVVMIMLLKRVNLSRGRRPLHWLSAGATAAARGLNDAPKLGGLGALLFQTVLASRPSATQALALTLLIAVAMGAGSYVGGLRVTETLGEKVTRMDDREGFAANLTTSALVTSAALSGLPGSTTHISGGAIMGIGAQARDGRVNLRVIREILLAWAVTVPAAGAIAVASWLLATRIAGPV